MNTLARRIGAALCPSPQLFAAITVAMTIAAALLVAASIAASEPRPERRLRSVAAVPFVEKDFGASDVGAWRTRWMANIEGTKADDDGETTAACPDRPKVRVAGNAGLPRWTTPYVYELPRVVLAGVP